jgi:multicomponent Na+:H+ antiporter subunit A
MPLTISIAVYFVVAAIAWTGGRRLRHGVTAIVAVPYVAQLMLVAWFLASGRPTSTEQIDWIPSLGVRIGVAIEPLTMLLTAIVAGIGLLIVIYSDAYFPDDWRRSRFLALMAVFTGGMAGIVVSNELLGLFVFWEITTVSSYLLIGFDDEKAQARAAALQAILVTTAGGLALLGGIVLLATEAGTTSIPELVSDPPTGTITTAALILVFIGAFTKSAQFPFQFWLPGAMAAPTPASAYLHSATMVKAGIVLLVFLAPGFASTSLWLWVVTATGLVTMVVGAVIALRQPDLKLLLAYGTVSQLGFMTALIGLGYTATAIAVLVAHSLFKAAMFLVVGIVDKATGTRDIRQLSGVGRQLPLVAAAGAVAAASMAGIPPLLGFVTKEAAFDLLISRHDWVSLAVIAAASALTVAYAAQWWIGAFGTPGGEQPTATKSVAGRMVMPTVVLGLFTIGLGLWPKGLGEVINESFADPVKLVLWPGFKPALALSAVVVAVGAIVAYVFRDGRWERLPTARSLHLPSGAVVYRASVRGLNTSADFVTGIVQNGSLPVYIAVIVFSVLFVPTVTWLFDRDVAIDLPFWNSAAEGALVGIIVVAAIAATRAQRRMAAVLLLGAVGYSVAGIYVVFSAPDLALTQLLIETLTIALFALVLSKLPRRFGPPPFSLSQTTRVAVSVFAGLFVTATALVTSSIDPQRDLTPAYVSQSKDAGGSNVVNVILTNFRAIDTLGEITVLAAAGIGISALILTIRAKRSEQSP